MSRNENHTETKKSGLYGRFSVFHVIQVALLGNRGLLSGDVSTDRQPDDQHDHSAGQEQVEEDFGDACCRGGYTGKTEYRRDD